MKRVISSILTFLILFTVTIVSANAVNCQPTFNRPYVVEANCTWPGNYKVYGDITVGTRTVTVPSGRVLGVNLSSNKVTFTSGKILFSGTAKMDNSVSARYYQTYSYSTNSGVTNCPSGYEVLNTTPSNYQGSSTTSLGSSGSFYCGK